MNGLIMFEDVKRVQRRAEKDAEAYVAEHGRGYQSSCDWDAEAWAQCRHDLDLDGDYADSLWPYYLDAFRTAAS